MRRTRSSASACSTAEELRASSEAAGRNEQQEAIAPFVESVGADGVHEVVEDISGERG
jgi:hypothetical protein